MEIIEDENMVEPVLAPVEDNTENAEDVQAVTESKDMFGKLTDDVLIEILSHLPVEQIVVTSILSKRRKGLWKHVPTLDFSDLLSNEFQESVLVKERIEQFVTETLKHNDVKALKKLIINAEFVSDETRAIWFDELQRREVAELHLKVNAYMDFILNYPLPRRILNLSTLVKLVLYGFGIRETSNFGDHPTIKYLKFESITFDDADFITNFLHACPNLFELELNLCRWQSPDICIESRVQRLCLELLNTCAQANNYGETLMVTLATPKLKSLRVYDSIGNFNCVEFLEIVEVVIIADLCGDEDRVRLELESFLEKCSKVKILTLDHSEAFYIVRQSQCKRVTELTIRVIGEMAFLVEEVPSLRFCLSSIMKEYFPLLKKLILLIEKEEDEGDDELSCFFPLLLC